MTFRRPKFTDLSLEQQKTFGNGVGPDRFPTWLRHFLTERVSWFFSDASWQHHDFGYVIGGDAFDRWRCDWKFFRAMLKDSVSQAFLPWIIAAPLAIGISILFFIAVLFGGWMSFNYRAGYATAEDAWNAFLKQR